MVLTLSLLISVMGATKPLPCASVTPRALGEGSGTAILTKPHAGSWRTANSCSPNSAYLLLRLHGIDVQHSALANQFPQRPQGNSLTELRDVITESGLPTKVVKLTPAHLRMAPLPLIAHFEEELGVTGHYVVVTAATDQVVEFIDGTTAMVTQQQTSEFRKNWTGYALIVDQRRYPATIYVFVALAAAMLALFSLLWLQKRTLQLHGKARNAR
jgi:ABC-type bacteriocin/lantibiotic exporter with double-glycine peptidase domain